MARQTQQFKERLNSLYSLEKEATLDLDWGSMGNNDSLDNELIDRMEKDRTRERSEWGREREELLKQLEAAIGEVHGLKGQVEKLNKKITDEKSKPPPVVSSSVSSAEVDALKKTIRKLELSNGELIKHVDVANEFHEIKDKAVSELAEAVKTIKVIRTESVVMASQLKMAVKKIDVLKKENLNLRSSSNKASSSEISSVTKSTARRASIGLSVPIIAAPDAPSPVEVGVSLFLHPSDDAESLERKRNTTIAIIDAEMEKTRRTSLTNVIALEESAQMKLAKEEGIRVATEMAEEERRRRSEEMFAVTMAYNDDTLKEREQNKLLATKLADEEQLRRVNESALSLPIAVNAAARDNASRLVEEERERRVEEEKDEVNFAQRRESHRRLSFEAVKGVEVVPSWDEMPVPSFPSFDAFSNSDKIIASTAATIEASFGSFDVNTSDTAPASLLASTAESIEAAFGSDDVFESTPSSDLGSFPAVSSGGFDAFGSSNPSSGFSTEGSFGDASFDAFGSSTPVAFDAFASAIADPADGITAADPFNATTNTASFDAFGGTGAGGFDAFTTDAGTSFDAFGSTAVGGFDAFGSPPESGGFDAFSPGPEVPFGSGGFDTFSSSTADTAFDAFSSTSPSGSSFK